MILSLRRVAIFFLVMYFVLTCYILFKININPNHSDFAFGKLPLIIQDEDWNSWRKSTKQAIEFREHKLYKLKHNEFNKLYNVEIWGKAAISLYLWEHIFNGKLESKINSFLSYGFKQINNLKLTFRTGPGFITTNAPSDVQNLVLILNGRSEEKIAFARMWLDFLPQLHNLKSIILIVLGNERCENDWLVPYTTKAGGLINRTFIVYDSPLIDNDSFFQWPLGVATYRGFPKVDPKQLELKNSRTYICNFLGTVYPYSSREKLLNVIHENNLTQFCFIKAREKWKPKETNSSFNLYIQGLRQSDLTLNPVGQNTECYRIYEAMAFGSVPVVENVTTPGLCGNSQSNSVSAPLRLLKLLNAPVIYINDWNELPDLISKELKMSLEEKVNRRIKIVEFYEDFKLHFQKQLLSVIKSVYRK